ncbi:dihydrofolate reductase family protein [Spirillospora sp. NBC_00431]
MGKVIYGMHTSIDGYVEGPGGNFGFLTPAEDVHQAANDQARRAAAFLFGRRMFEMMEKPWTEDLGKEGAPAVEREFAEVYKETPRYVFSDTLQDVPEGVTLVRRADAVSVATRLKREIDGILEVSGPELAASLLDLIDEFWVYAFPVIVGGGKPFLPVGEELRLRLVEHRSFASGVMFLRYVRA